MERTTLRRTGALLASAGLLAALTVGTVAAPAAAGKCEPYSKSALESATSGCFYATGPIDDSPTVPAGVTLTGSDSPDVVDQLLGTFNGGAGNDAVRGDNDGTFNGGPGDDVADFNYGTFNGGPGNDFVRNNFGTFNGAGGNDEVWQNVGGTFAGGGGDDCYVSDDAGTIYSATQGCF